MIKKLLLFFISIVLLSPLIIWADLASGCREYCTDPEAYDGPPHGQICICNPLEAEDFETIIENLINFIFQIAVLLAPLMIIIGAFLLVTSGGSISRVERAKNIITWTLIGFAIILLAKGIITVIKEILEI